MKNTSKFFNSFLFSKLYSIFLITVFLISLLLSSSFLVSSSDSTHLIPTSSYPSSLAIYHGKLIVAFPEENCIDYYNGSFVPFLKVYDPEEISSNNYTIYIISNNTLLYYSKGEFVKLNVSEPFMLFYDNYTNLTYVTTYNCFVYELNGSQVLKKYFIYESFGYMTFNNVSAIVDSQAGYIFLYYNGSVHVTVNYQDALSGMAFFDGKFISGSFDPVGIFVFNNLSVLKLNVIAVVYLYQIRNYNISFIYTTTVPDFIESLNGVLYVASSQGLNAISLSNGEVFYQNNIPVYSMIKYDNEIYTATPDGLIIYNLTLPKIYYLKVEAEGINQWSFLLNGTKYALQNNSIVLPLTEGIYNLTFLSSSLEKPNISSIVFNLSSNKTLVIDYLKLNFTLNIYSPIKNYEIVINNKTIMVKQNNISLILPEGEYSLKIIAENYNITPSNLIVLLYHNTSIKLSAIPITATSSQTLTSGVNNSSIKNSSNSLFNILVALIIVIIVVFIVLITIIIKSNRRI
ncbi:hypothetical protein DFR86_11745 [Acidianus sulfidivorans JP7]|uniref:Uncharacterized protein n=1 Tax=Acidianus sulfidivorans JP7 TaxID=619593 RepID=A0A2U9IQ56_9CREN|nr:hypothetical protein [Acidianus sulfidivorans]AWR98142.1 hypothetical protein DFR86_11745 [Acidianus sulfidivorans JP7]